MAISTLLQSIRSIPAGYMALNDEYRRITYGRLAELIDAESRWLSVEGKRFAVLADNGCGWAVADLALHHAQLLNVPLPAYFSPKQLSYLIQDAHIDSVLTDQPARVHDLWPSFTPVGVSERSGLTLLRQTSSTVPNVPAVAKGSVKVTYTSGSTAEPKGVCLSASALEAVAHSVAQVTAPIRVTRHLCLMPLPTLLENVAGIYAALLSGACCTLPTTADTGVNYGAVDPEKVLRTLTRSEPESVILVPELLRLIVIAANRGRRIPSSLKFIAVGGAPVSRELLTAATELGLPVFQGYGLSECASVVCLNTPATNRLGSVGRPLPHAGVRRDEKGELHVRGALMDGHLGAMANEPLAELATGDLGEIDPDGFVYINGRMRNIFISSLGRNVAPEWIERELTHETVIRHALAYGEAQPFAVALISPALPDVDADSVARAVARANCRLPAYAQVRRWAMLPERPSLENGLLTANGRLRRDHLLNRYGALIDALYAAPARDTKILQTTD